MVVGQTLGHYTIQEKLGAGGMGEVYLAEDMTLKRQVALKVLPTELAASKERLDRFQREAETLAALDHPNIVVIHTVEEAEGVRFLTMQLVKGKRLSELIPKGGMPLDRLFEIAIPLADALAAAHEKGVIHRDLKPGNIMVTAEGRVKVLDFGLAKLRAEPDAGEATELPTEPLTDEGRILGTVPYMSPEQLEGKELDARTDIFSLGVVLYEMATGERPFKGDSSVSVMSSIMKDTPREADSVRADLPHHLARIIRHCLEKEPRRRYQSALDVRNELEDLKSESASGEVWRIRPPLPSRRRALLRWVGLAAASIALMAVLAAVFWVWLSDQEQGAAGRRAGTFTKLVFDTAQKGKSSASPDGRFFVYASDAAGNWDIYLQRIAGGKAINLTEDSSEDDRQPAFSPDGESIAFRSEREGGGIFIMGATGESVRRVTDHGFFPDWSPDGSKIVFSTFGDTGPWTEIWGSRIWTVDVLTGKLSIVLDRSAVMPDWSPSGQRIAYYGFWKASETKRQNDLFTVAAAGGQPIAVTEDIHFEDFPAWSPDGRSLYYVSNQSGTRDLWRVAIDETTGAANGTPEPITSGSSVSYVSPSGDGRRVLYSSTNVSREILGLPFDPVAEAVVGPRASITPPGLQPRHPSVSPDGEWLAFDAEFGQPGEFFIGVIRKDGSALRQLSGIRGNYPRWSRDGQRLTFKSRRSGTSQVWIINVDGSGLRQLTDEPGKDIEDPIWSPDGSRLATCTMGDLTTYVFDADKPWSEEPPNELPLFGDADDQFWPTSWSPDGKRLAGYRSRRDCVCGIVLYSFESGSYQVLTEVGIWPYWLNDSRRLLFVDDPSTAIFLLDTETGEIQEVISSENLSLPSNSISPPVVLSPDNRTIYFHVYQRQDDIWILTFDQ